MERGSKGDKRVGLDGVSRREAISWREARTLGVEVGVRSEFERTLVQ